MKVKFSHRRNGKYYIPTFTIGVQTFSLQDCENKASLKFFHKMLKKAFKNLIDESTNNS